MSVIEEKSTLYDDVALRIVRLIDAGTLRTGERIPSVRKLSRQLKVSVSTVLQAYRLLEDRGRIEARPQSGYYVRQRHWQAPAEPDMSRPPRNRSVVTVGDLVMKVLDEAKRPGVVPLGAALVGSELLPTQQLNRFASAVARRSPKVVNTYDVPPGCPALRVQVARRSLEAGCALSPDELVTTIGSQEAIGLCLRAVAKAGDTIAIESPTYYGVLQTIEVFGMRALEIPTHPRDGINLDALETAIRKTPSVKAVLVVSNFNNPLGSCMSDDNKKRLVQILAGFDIPLVEDDVYGDLGFSAHRPKVAKAFDTKGLVLLCSSFSKTLAPGYRVGWCAPGRYKAEVERLKFVTTLASPIIPQLAIAEFLASGGYDHHLRRVRKAYADQVERVTESVGKYFPAGTKATRPAGGFVLWVELPEDVNSLDLHERAIEHGITIAPGPIFSATQKFENFIRLNCGFPWSDDLDRALKTLGGLCSSRLA